MDAAITDLLKPLAEGETRTDEEHQARCRELLDYGQRLHEQIVAERQEMDEVGAEIRAITARIKAM